MYNYFSDFLKLFFPQTCIICNMALYPHEKLICRKCISILPRTTFHTSDDNVLNQIFWGRVDIEKCTSFLFYTHGSIVKEILHGLKYGNRKELGYELGKLYGEKLCEHGWLDNIDYLIPVPLHPQKLAKRGYNQSEWIANGLANVAKAKVMTDNLYKKTNTTSQTNKGRYKRWLNINTSFDIRNPSLLTNKTVALVDDVLTTGATIEACANKLATIEGIKINVITLAYAAL